VASYAQLQNDVTAWLNRRDVGALIPSWVTMVETDIAEVLRARCMVVRGDQAIDANFITLPDDWIAAESIRFKPCGHLLSMEDHFTGPLAGGPDCGCHAAGPSWAYRIVGPCIEFLPHPTIPQDLAWRPQIVEMAWYAKPKALNEPQSTNKVLDTLYQIYLFGVCKYGAMFEKDDDVATQMDGAFNGAVAAANLWKVTSDMSGAPLRAVVRGF